MVHVCSMWLDLMVPANFLKRMKIIYKTHQDLIGENKWHIQSFGSGTASMRRTISTKHLNITNLLYPCYWERVKIMENIRRSWNSAIKVLVGPFSGCRGSKRQGIVCSVEKLLKQHSQSMLYAYFQSNNWMMETLCSYFILVQPESIYSPKMVLK